MDSRRPVLRLRVLRKMDIAGKIILLRVDHNVVKKGKINDSYRIDATLATLYAIAQKGGSPILMTHIGRPKDKKTGKIRCDEGDSVIPIARYIEMKLFGGGDTLQELKNLCPGIYMSGLDDPNTYYFTGGGSVLTAIEQGSPYGLKPVQVLMQ